MSTPSGRPFDARYESQLSEYRKTRRLLRLNSIHFKAARSKFEKACRDKLSDSEGARFFWPQPDKAWNKHPGWVMLAFTTRDKCDKAEEELKDFEFWGRKIGVQRAHTAKRTQPTGQATASPAIAAAPTANPFLVPAAAAPSAASAVAADSTIAANTTIATHTAMAAGAAIAAAQAAVNLPGATPQTIALAAAAAIEAVANITTPAPVIAPVQAPTLTPAIVTSTAALAPAPAPASATKVPARILALLKDLSDAEQESGDEDVKLLAEQLRKSLRIASDTEQDE